MKESENTQVADPVIENDNLSDGPCDDELQRFIDKYAGDGKTRFQAQYHDNPDGWTVPVLLTKERAFRLKNDYSVSRVKFIMQSAL